MKGNADVRIKSVSSNLKAGGIRIKGRHLLLILYREFASSVNEQAAYALNGIMMLKPRP